ncbi:MAG: HEPN domain-containing protein [Bacteroidota bacterium]|nr:HEPN domain-containing protein [Bacteroidota bacterium]
MSFEPKEFIKISKELSVGETEAHFRSLINRAYYGVFGYIKKQLPINAFDASVHQEVIAALKRSTKINEKKAGSRLETLFKRRKDADYKYDIEIHKNTCHYIISDAEEIIKLFDTKDIEK